MTWRLSDEGLRSTGAKVLVAPDGSEASLRATELAVGLAGVLGARLHVLYVVDEDGAFRTGIHYGEAVRGLAASGGLVTGEVAALAEGAGVEHEETVVMGDPAGTILAVAQDVGADYVVVGANGTSRLGQALFGGVAEEVLRRAERRVILVGGKREGVDPLLRALRASDAGARAGAAALAGSRQPAAS